MQRGLHRQHPSKPSRSSSFLPRKTPALLWRCGTSAVLPAHLPASSSPQEKKSNKQLKKSQFTWKLKPFPWQEDKGKASTDGDCSIWLQYGSGSERRWGRCRRGGGVRGKQEPKVGAALGLFERKRKVSGRWFTPGSREGITLPMQVALQAAENLFASWDCLRSAQPWGGIELFAMLPPSPYRN